MEGYNGKLIIFTSFYEHRALAEYCMSLYQTTRVLEKLGVNFDYWGQEGGFHIESSINSALTAFAEDPEATDIMMIDADESWKPEDVAKLLLRKEPVIGGTYRMKNNFSQYVGDFVKDENGNIKGKLTGENTAIAEANRFAAGFLRIKKEVLLKYIEAYPDDYFYLAGKKVYPFFWNEIKDHIFTGMDYCLSDKIKALGYQIWIDPAIEISHWGMTEYKGNYDKYLRNRKAIQDVKEMAEDGKRSI